MTRHSRAVALAAALLYAGFVVTQVAAVEDTEPSFRIEEAELDLGTIVAGTIATATFVFHNDGPDDVHIIRAKPS
ncbi:MAG: hypothetical protein IFK93_05630 [Acidobacteria bacterium]|uniref:DUF1573 domain-containing protein n=1 Tax=Candidatus Sulfomarinibacter kjeldsenii TaxID=2885994 RepID=A0A8J7CF37_9BACT|nr:hypothetical protein [Candidatus Sulfomarinibacter kjeldsenii]MBD3855141.1 hypothetical protein [Candidatus Sulfomarinibacter kjeldsenii]MBD3871202.1 hypothetical protein [Candidatus Sulfomarinibacter kjeldsenii]